MFKVNQTKEGEEEYYYNLNYKGKEHKLYQHSYLGFGINLAREQFEKGLNETTEQDQIENPCLPAPYTRFSNVLNKTMIGTSNDQLCFHLISNLFDKNCDFVDCSWNNTFQAPFYDSSFVSLDNSFKTAKFLKLDFSSTSASVFNDSANMICAFDLPQFQSHFNVTDPENYCFQSFFISAIWNIGFGFPEGQVIPVYESYQGVK